MPGLFDRKPPVKIIKEIQKLLGPQYYLTVRDFENVLCRKINDCYELELSGLDNQRRTTYQCWIYVNYIGPESKFPVAEMSDELKSWGAIKNFIYRMEEKYRDLD